MFLTQLYTYIFAPKDFIARYNQFIPYKLGWLGLVIFSVVLSVLFNPSLSLFSLFISSSVYFFLIFLNTVLTVTCIDFFAQLFHLKAQSKGLFFWILTTYLLTSLFIPVYLFSLSSGVVSFIVLWVVLSSIVSLQIYVIKRLYYVSTLKSFLLYLSPLAVVLFLGFIVVGVVGNVVVQSLMTLL